MSDSWGDYDRLRQMFLIIVDNAVKFSEKNGRIEIFLMRKEQKESVQLFVQIKDHGIGIPEEQLPYIFEKFYTSKLRQNQNGTGLGLMIAKQIAKRHDGDISVESTREKEPHFPLYLRSVPWRMQRHRVCKEMLLTAMEKEPDF